ncbi:MAG: hypothetical protein MJ016_00800, partial [Victivallaceae bacterium]|nr:hypothetical protein [Victivallaceae bacterium]
MFRIFHSGSGREDGENNSSIQDTDEAGSRSRFDRIEETFRKSAVPGVAMFTLIWVVCALFLTLSIQRRKEFGWRIGQAAPESVYARCDFSYEDIEATEKARIDAANKALRRYFIDPVATAELEKSFRDYFNGIAFRAAGKTLDSTAPVARLVNRASVELVKFIDRRRGDMLERAHRTINRGIMPASERVEAGSFPVKVIDLNGNGNSDERTVADYPDAEIAAKKIAGEPLPRQNAGDALSSDDALPQREEFIAAARELIGDRSNIRKDENASASARIEAMRKVGVVVREKHAQDLIIEKGAVVTQTTRDMLDAQMRALPANFGKSGLVYNLVGGLILLGIAIFYLAVLRPEVIRNPRHTAVATITICLSLWINFLGIGVFDRCLRAGIIELPQLIVCALPVALPMLLMSVTLGVRAGFIVGVLTASVTALMIDPDQQRPLELVVRWILVGGIGMFVVRKVVSCRAWFVRICLAMVLLGGISSFDLLLRGGGNVRPENVVAMAEVLLLSGFFCAVAALVLIFALELIFNLDTNMALTVLGNFSHPLLERMKREAPGTMFHSITVATLAEDAARAIGANAL